MLITNILPGFQNPGGLFSYQIDATPGAAKLAGVAGIILNLQDEF